MKTPRTIHYSQLKYQDIPYQRGGNPRVFYLEQDLNLYKEVGKDLLCLARKLAIWIKVNYRKELLIAFVMTAAFTAKGYAEPVKPVAPIYKQPSYTKPVSPIAAVQPISVPVPQEVSPVPVPQPVAPPPAPVAPVVAPEVAPVNNAPSGCGDNFYANYIYMHESGCSTVITNSIGCLGIGQACPASKLLAVCPNLDYTCENSFFTAYSAKYGGWAGSYAFWVAHRWW